jgi:ABC-type multidrug transport system fused ATPase/permease subunit
LPILFATVIGRASRACLVWRLELGEKLGVLDMLASSTTFASAMLAQITLRGFSAIGFLLAAVWALSPVGGQASLRIMTVGQMTVTNTASFDYLSPVSSYNDWISSSGGHAVEVTAKGLYLAALTSPTRAKDSPTDLWGNAKIPMLEDIPG